MTHWTVPVVEIRTADGRVDPDFRHPLCPRAPLRRDHLVLRRRSPRHLVGRHPRHVEAPLLAADALDRSGRRRPHGPGDGGHRPVGPRRAARRACRCGNFSAARRTASRPTNADGRSLNLDDAALVEDLTSLIDHGWSRVKIKVGRPDWRETSTTVASRPQGDRGRRHADVQYQPALGPVDGEPDHAHPRGGGDGLGRGAVPCRRSSGARPSAGLDPAGYRRRGEHLLVPPVRLLQPVWQGIGYFIAAALVARGVRVVVTDRNVETGAAAAKELGCAFLPLDVRTRSPSPRRPTRWCGGSDASTSLSTTRG